MLTYKSSSKIFFCCILIAALCSCNPDDKQTHLPQPTDVKMDMEDGDKKSLRDQYIEMVHGGPDVDWRSIETQNAFDLLDEKRALRLLNNNRTDEEWVAGGNIKGKWIERGSSNQAGNIRITAYDQEEDIIYCIGGGGPMYKGNRFGVPWELVNDDLRFSGSLLQVIKNEEGDKRLVAAINGTPFYSDDEGASWSRASGIGGNGGTLYDQAITSNEEIFFVHKPGYWDNLRIYKSGDNGTSFASKLAFNTSDRRNITLTKAIDSDDVFVLEQIEESKSILHKYNPATDEFEILNSSVDAAFGDGGNSNLIAQSADSLRFYLFDNDLQFHVLKDSARVIELISYLPSRPWQVAAYMPGSDPNNIMYGEVNPYRSLNGGKNWIKISDWWEYYNNVEQKIHADIMSIDEYYTTSGDPFILVGNHGGISITEDYGKTLDNIGLLSLNVGQFYDAKSLPNDHNVIFGGTQDQGLQRGRIKNEEPDDFTQMVSGDYGHLQFTGPERNHLWTVYPGGAVGFYIDPLTQGGASFGYNIESNNETVWIPPTMLSTDPTQDIIYIAGGSTDNSSNGTHIIKLERIGQEIVATDLPYDFQSSGGTISAMAISEFDPNIWYIATTNGRFYKSEDGGQDFKLLNSNLAGSHYLYGSWIMPSKTNPDVVYLSGNGYNNSSSVFKSSDQGQTWEAMRRGMSPTVAFKIVSNEDESLIFAATEAGPFVWIQEEEKWFSLVGELTPNQTYWSVEWIEEINTARFATYGRGIWDFEVTSLTPTNTTDPEVALINLYPNPTANNLTIELDGISNYDVKVTDMSGKQYTVVKVNSNSNKLDIDVSAYPKGSYIIYGQNTDQKFSSKFVKN